MTPRSAHSPTPGASSEGELSTVDALAQMAFLIQGTLERRAAEHGLSLIQTRLLGVLRDRQPTINELARLLELDKSSVSGLVNRAERRGLVQRATSAVDRRSVSVGLTADGRALASKLARRFETDVAAMLDPLGAAERAALRSLLSHVLVVHAAVAAST